ncbi:MULTISPECIES: NAD(P)H-quinone oxidoreductase [unclassified Brevundimonas]|uniref:NAD(P)H-quinone oxidoreductase n=1 Tax=unclassified Brevundimonas TaxID=2622653 RepID=UPI000CFA92FD|nr:MULTISPECIES: NAD(P)H-quinone oxidoreductase [unclassified Brevundimonas]PRA26479.1 NAD(P)H-quinone oxidoreductase [Brevundimonas sp. MYb27]PQZ83193.1 NAD(P)H-quinone oxidoreductase [Brevundimonas sp. MYb31]PRB16273.1 NAD(P)H-quinone oxidoreductase [Brevundimonas sp. MYb52]PRB35115.1 NAD(P)H-quinone oxidoreductase [Brevundimonas sp. MYb46]PRB49800.1 NAD(P)H-quinone oxidoreductase [Brevundimonas sp. MYb33]
MRVIEIEGGQGPADALRLAERPLPAPAAGEIRVRVRAAGVNRPDIVQREGRYPPPPGASDILGLEIAGEVDAVGDGVARWSVGDRVCALLGGGGYADYAVVDARHALPVPDGLDFVQAAALPETAFTVFANVFEGGGLKAGETLLIHGATSGIGVMAIQMAKAAGARVIATSRGAAKAKAAHALGADVSLDATNGDLLEAIRAEGGADVVLDMVGAAYAELNLNALKPGGRWVVIATLTGALAQIDLMRVMLKRVVLTGSTLRSRPADEKARLAAAVEQTVWPWVASGGVQAQVQATFPLDRAAAAHQRLEAGDHVGKIVLTL